MLKCPHCGANLSLEDETCPYCGQVNEEARLHARKMKSYQGKFARTEEEVYRSVRRWRKVTVRGIILGILVVLAIVIASLNSSLFSLRRTLKRGEANRRAAELTGELNRLLEKQDYLTLAQVFSHYEIDVYGSEAFEKYSVIRSAARQYQNLYMDLAQAEMPGNGGRNRYLRDNLADDMEYFFRAVSEERISEDRYCDPEQTRAAFAGMQEQMEGFFRLCLKITPEQASELKDMSKSRRGLLLEEVFPDEE